MQFTYRFLAFAFCLGGVVRASDAASVIEIPTPSSMSLPQGLDVASDGSVFYTETGAGKIARLQNVKVTREYSLPKGASPNIVKIATDGVWFTDGGNAAVGRLDPNSGAILEYRVPSGAAPNFLQIASDGSKWFTEPSGVGRLSPSGVITEWQITLEKTDSHIEQLSIDPAGDVWFTELNYDGVGPNGTNLVRRLHPATNLISAFPVPTFGGTPAGVVAAPSGRVWVSEYFAGKLALLDPKLAPHTSVTVNPASASTTHNSSAGASASTPATRTLTSESGASRSAVPIASPGWLEYTIPTPGANAEDMRLDPKGLLFFEEDGGFLGELDPGTGAFVEYSVPSPNSGYYNIALAGHALWFAEAGAFGPVPTKVGVLLW